MRPRRMILMLFGALVGLVILGLAGFGALSLFRRVTEKVATGTLPSFQGAVMPPGFKADVYVKLQDAALPTVVTFGPDNLMYVVTVGGKIFRVTDKDGDLKGETVEVLFDNADNRLVHAAGLAFHDGKMFISDSGRVSTFEDTDNDGKLDKLTPIVEGLPSLIFPDHSTNGIAFGQDGKLYMGVGATTDHGPLQKPMEASIVRMNPDGSDLEVFATGFRNPFDVAFSPDGALFTADNNPSQLDMDLRYLPPEELNFVQQGGDYGFPRVYGVPPAGDNSLAPVTDFYASVGSSGLVYYAADAFPPEWRDGVYVAQWGTGANVALDRSITNGQALVFTSLTRTPEGNYTGDWKPFLYFDTPQRLRPVDVTVGPDGALYMLEFSESTVYRIHYDGAAAASATATTAPTAEPLPEFSAEQIAAGEVLFTSGANGAPPCVTCHLADGKVGLGPSLEGLKDVAGTRVPGLGALEYVRQSITIPNAHVVTGFNANYMYQNYANDLTVEQIDELAAYVLSLEKSS